MTKAIILKWLGDIKEKYLEALNRAFYEGYYYDNDAEKPDEEFNYDKDDADIDEDYVSEWFGTRDYEKYLVKMLRAEVASSYPKLGDYYGESSTDDGYGNLKDKNRRLCSTRSSSAKKNKNE